MHALDLHMLSTGVVRAKGTLFVLTRQYAGHRVAYRPTQSVPLAREKTRLEKFFGGLRELRGLPDLVVIVGQQSEKNAVDECQKLGITTITLLDSNCDPTLSTYGITANDDSTRAVAIILASLAAD
jgi:small subunit ribosomal protein S2